MPDVAPVIGLLRLHAEGIRRAEVARASERLDALTPGERHAVEAVTTQIVDALLRTPTARIEEAAERAEARRYAAGLRDLFALEEVV